MDFAAIYRESRIRLMDLAPGLDAQQLGTIVPACPEWTVKDAYAHVVGVARNILDREPASGRDETSKQVADRAHQDIAAICEEWGEVGERFEVLLGKVGDKLAAPVIDVWTHEQDIRGALGMDGIRAGDGLELTLKAARMVGTRLDAAGLSPIALTIPGAPKTYILGTLSEGDEPGISLTGDRYELARTFLSRRSLSQMGDLDWSRDPSSYLPHLGPWDLPATDLSD